MLRDLRSATSSGTVNGAVRTGYVSKPSPSASSNGSVSTISQVLSVARQVLMRNSSSSNTAAAVNSNGNGNSTSGKSTPAGTAAGRLTPTPPTGHAPTAASTSQQLSTGRRIDRTGSGKR